MSKSSITILCPSGHRRKAQMTPNTNLLQALEDICVQEDLDPSEWGLTHQRKKCDLTMPWRLSGIPTNALLEMFKLEERRATSDVTVQLQLPNSSRHTGSFNPSTTLQEMLDWYRNQPESVIAALDNSMNNNDQMVHPVCSYMSEEVIGKYALSNTTLREFGLTSGTAVIRYNNRSIPNDEFKKINDRIDEKIARRNRQQQQQQSTSTPSSAPPSATTFNLPPPSVPLPATTVSYDTDEYSIFREPPVFPRTTTQQQPKTLAEALGIDISFSSPSLLKQPPQTDLSNFKFPEATKGLDLQTDDSSSNLQHRRGSKPNDRHTIAYDLSKKPSKSPSSTEEIPDSFFELTPDDLRSIITTLRQQGADENPLETRSMRERNQMARANSYPFIAIRLVINSNYALQGLFYPQEPLSNLIEFARTNLVCPQLEKNDFYLYTSPPRVVLSDLTKSLSMYDLAPAAFVYLGHRTISPLNIQLESNVPIGTINEADDIVTRYVFNRTESMNEETTSKNSSEASNRSTKRNPTTQTIDDKHLRDKMAKFLPGKK